MRRLFSIFVVSALCCSPLASAQTASWDYSALTRQWYEDGVKKANGAIVMDMLAEDINWWCFGPAGFAMNDHYMGKSGPQAVTLFFKRADEELVVDTDQKFHIEKIETQSNVVTVYGLETGPITPLISTNAPSLKGPTFFNYFIHRLEFDQNGKIAKFRCNWALSDHLERTSPF